MLGGCWTHHGEYTEADEVAYGNIADAQRDIMGEESEFSVDNPEQHLRKRLLETQDLPVMHPVSKGVEGMERIEHWPEGAYPEEDERNRPAAAPVTVTHEKPVKLTLLESLQVAARNSRDYQSQKESLYRTALTLDLRRYDFSTQFSADADAEIQDDRAGNDPERSWTADTSLRATRRFQNGALLSGGITFNFLRMLTGDPSSTAGVSADASISIPLARGAGEHIAREALTQAERNMLYAVYDYERFKRNFVVGIASDYYDSLRQLDSVRNARENFRRLQDSVKRTELLSEAGRLPEIQVDQARQDELRARSGLISALEGYRGTLDSFKVTLGLPADADIELDEDELKRLLDVETMPDPDAVEELDEEWLDEARAIAVALHKRLDLRVAYERIQDAQRDIVIAADDFLPEVTLGARARWSESDEASEFTDTLQQVRFNRGVYTGFLTIDPGLERTLERNGFREQLISLQSTIRNYQSAEDRVKVNIRSAIRRLKTARENLVIQRNSSVLAQRRVTSTELFLQAGRANVRDLLEAESDLLDARNAYTSALVSYRIAFLSFQRDLGLLEVDENGLWYERNYRNLLEESNVPESKEETSING